MKYDYQASLKPPTTPEDGPSYALGFQTLESEVELEKAPVTGRIPSWLSGTLVRTGPAKFEVGQQKFNHWFDGLGMLHRFSLEGGEVSYGNKFIQSKAYMEAMENDQISFREFATDPDPDQFRHVSHGYEPHGTDNAIVNIVKIRDKILATTQMPLPIEFDPKTLKTKGTFDFEDNVPDGFTTPHPQVDSENGYLYNFTISLDPPVSHNLYRFDGTTRELLTIIPTEAPSFLNSFALTDRYVIFVEQPYRLDYMSLIAGGKAFASCFDWNPDEPCRFWVIDRSDGEVVGTLETDAFFFLHHINAYEEAGDLVVDMITYEDPEIIQALYLDNLRAGGSIPVPHVQRFRLSVAADGVEAEALGDAFVELPCINSEMVNGRPYRYFYGFGGYGSELDGVALTFESANSLIKVDAGGGETKVWRQENCFPGGPSFVAQPGGTEEDDGVILSIVLDAAASQSFLLVLDARTMQELGRADLPHHVPFSLGGNFFPNDVLKDIAAPAISSSAGVSVEDFYAAIKDLPESESTAGRSGWRKRLGH